MVDVQQKCGQLSEVVPLKVTIIWLSSSYFDWVLWSLFHCKLLVEVMVVQLSFYSNCLFFAGCSSWSLLSSVKLPKLQVVDLNFFFKLNFYLLYLVYLQQAEAYKIFSLRNNVEKSVKVKLLENWEFIIIWVGAKYCLGVVQLSFTIIVKVSFRNQSLFQSIISKKGSIISACEQAFIVNHDSIFYFLFWILCWSSTSMRTDNKFWIEALLCYKFQL